MRWDFVDLISKTDEETYIQGFKTFPQKDEWYQDHFPGKMIIPGVLQIETAANFLGKLVLLRGLIENGEWTAPILLKTFDCSFKEMIRPGEEVQVFMGIDKWTRKIVRGSGEIKVGDTTAAKISIALGRNDPALLGDPEFLKPWQAKQIRKCYPSPSEALEKYLRDVLKKS